MLHTDLTIALVTSLIPMCVYQNELHDKKRTILVLTDYYLPGYKSGGPVRTIANMVEDMSDEYSFRIITRDRDCGDDTQYPGILAGEWMDVGNSKVFYVAPTITCVYEIVRVIRNTHFDVLYLNSYFSRLMTFVPLLAVRMMWIGAKPVVVAPRGEFSPGALSVKSIRKRLYTGLVKLFGLYSNVVWQGSTKSEMNDILRLYPNGDVFVARDLVSTKKCRPFPTRSREVFRLIFLSRITPMKNLAFLLTCLRRVRARVKLLIYGPVDDPEYWSKCKPLLEDVPTNVDVHYKGPIPQEEVARELAASDLLVLPTKGENFGHVIYESLCVGTPVLISDNTPWRGDQSGGCKVCSLSRPECFVEAIEEAAHLSAEEYRSRRYAAVNYVKTVLKDVDARAENIALFSYALRG